MNDKGHVKIKMTDEDCAEEVDKYMAPKGDKIEVWVERKHILAIYCL